MLHGNSFGVMNLEDLVEVQLVVPLKAVEFLQVGTINKACTICAIEKRIPTKLIKDNYHK